MADAPERTEIDHYTIKLIVGLIALLLPVLTSALSGNSITSISASYYVGGWTQTIFIGFLFAIAAYMLAYNGRAHCEKVMSKIAAVAGAGVALFPCGCDGRVVALPYAHYGAAAAMFGILAVFAYRFYRRASGKGHVEAKVRAGVYWVCCAGIAAAIALMLVDFVTNFAVSRVCSRFTFWSETAGLVAFGVSWLTASHVLPWLNREDERLRLW